MEETERGYSLKQLPYPSIRLGSYSNKRYYRIIRMDRKRWQELVSKVMTGGIQGRCIDAMYWQISRDNPWDYNMKFLLYETT